MKAYILIIVSLVLAACTAQAPAVQLEPCDVHELTIVTAAPTIPPAAVPTTAPTPAVVVPIVAHYVDLPDQPDSVQVVAIEDGVANVGVRDWVTTCKETAVYGNPYGLNEPFYTLPANSTVRVHDISQSGNGWLMIETSRWIPPDAVCP